MSSIFDTMGEAPQELIGSRIKLIEMVNDPDPVPPGTEGKIYWQGAGALNVEWDNGRNIAVLEGVDKYEIL